MSKLSIKEEMRALDTRNKTWYKNLSDEDKEKFNKSMWTQMRWASSVRGENSALYLILVNDFANTAYGALKNHPQLLHQCLQLAGSGKSEYHEWIAPGKRGKKNKLIEWLATQHPEYNYAELELLVETNDSGTWGDILEQQGYSKKEIKDMLK